MKARRAAWVLSLLESLRQDLSYAQRALRRSPAFTIIVVVTLALGIGANAAIFSVVNAVILRALPYPDPERLLSIAVVVNGGLVGVSPRDFMDWRRDARSFAGLAASYSGQTILTADGDAERVTQARVTANTFDVLSVRPTLGRAFVEGEDGASAPRVAILGEELWRRRFGGDSGIIGRSIVLDDFPTTVVGVAPTSMQWPQPVDVWLTTRFSERDLAERARGHGSVTVVGRLARSATLASARAELDVIARRTEQPHAYDGARAGIRVTPLLASLIGGVRMPLLVVLSAVAFVLLVACANVGGLALSRVAARDTELALRTALGASRARLARQLLTESVLLAVLGGALGLLLAFVSLDGLVALAPAHIPRLRDVSLDGRVVTVTFAVTMLTALVFGIAPAAQGAATDLHARLRVAGRARDRSSVRSRRALVVVESTLATVLLTGAGLLLRTLARLSDVDPGFRAAGVSTFHVGQLPRSYSTKTREVEFTRQLLEGIRRLPGVDAADVTFDLPLHGSTQMALVVGGAPASDPDSPPRAEARAAGPQYFAALGIPLLRGRLFDDRDRGGGPGVPRELVISAELARRVFRGEDPIGKHLETEWSGPGWPGVRFGGEVIGIVGDVRQQALDENVSAHMYMSYEQWPINEYDVVIHSTTPSSLVLRDARSVLKQLDANIPMNDARPFSRDVDASLGNRRFYLTLLGAFATLAVALAIIGVYGVMAYGVQLRRRELGVRLALGATRERILASILLNGMRIAVMGVVLGIATAYQLTRVLQSLLYEVGPHDPLTFLSVSAAVLVVTACACMIPAWKATRVDPAETMRRE